MMQPVQSSAPGVAMCVAMANTRCSARDGPAAPLRSVEVADATGDVESSRPDGGLAPRGVVDLGGAVLRDQGDVLVVEFEVEDGVRPPESTSPVGDLALVYVMHLWGEDPGNWFTVRAIVEDGAGTTAKPGDLVHVCDKVTQLGRCDHAEVDPVCAVQRTDGRFTYEVRLDALSTARTAGSHLCVDGPASQLNPRGS